MKPSRAPEPPPYKVVASRTKRRVEATSHSGETSPPSQVHRGYTPLVYLPGQRDPIRPGSFHQKSSAAVKAGEVHARKLLREQAKEK